MNKLNVISHDSTPFVNRVEAGRRLGEQLARYKGRGAVVLGIMRGGVIVAREVAREIEGELDLVFARKLGAPGNPELAIGDEAQYSIFKTLVDRGRRIKKLQAKSRQ